MKRVIKRMLLLIIQLFFLLVFSVVGLVAWTLYQRGHGRMECSSRTFTETAEEVDNGDRGFYYIYGFRINDNDIDYEALITERFKNDTETNLAMVQVNLQAYREGEISEAGLKHLDQLFHALQNRNKRYIVRFLYDWDGKNAEQEPESIHIILRHMEQVGPTLMKYQDLIYVTQGLFIGNWGEMNGTRYSDAESMRLLAQTLAHVTGDDIFLSVRMPAQWRTITECGNPLPEKNTLSSRLGLFNDGILGNASDYGTYGSESAGEENCFSAWCREDELEFQETLCRYVPNGGETIIENEWNDFDNALDAFRTMHLSYLNRDYDRNVLNKWAESVVSEGSCFDGMDGLTYMERHLGYRYLIIDSALTYNVWEDVLRVDVNLKNVGFAPIYEETKAVLTVLNEQGELIYTDFFSQDLRKLCGGNEFNEKLTYELDVCVTGWPGWEQETYEVYFGITEGSSERWLELANEQKMGTYGYHIGTLMGGAE